MLLAFDCAKSISNLWNICLGVNILRLEWSETLSEKPGPTVFIENILLANVLRVLPIPSKSLHKFSSTSSFLCL